MLARGKMRCVSVERFVNHEKLRFMCQYNEGDPEDTRFSANTPSGDLDLTITNPNLIGEFEPGKAYYVSIAEPIE